MNYFIQQNRNKIKKKMKNQKENFLYILKGDLDK